MHSSAADDFLARRRKESTMTNAQMVEVFKLIASDCRETREKMTIEWSQGYYEGRAEAWEAAAKFIQNWTNKAVQK